MIAFAKFYFEMLFNVLMKMPRSSVTQEFLLCERTAKYESNAEFYTILSKVRITMNIKGRNEINSETKNQSSRWYLNPRWLVACMFNVPQCDCVNAVTSSYVPSHYFAV